MLFGQREVTGVTFQRTTAPPPIVSGPEAGNKPVELQEMELDGQ